MGVSTHVLNTTLGRPAAGVAVTLARATGGEWTTLNETATDADGRCKFLLPEDGALEAGNYRVHFDTAEYYAGQAVQGLYPYIEIVFTVTDPAQHFHIPLLLTANSYTTYRGS